MNGIAPSLLVEFEMALVEQLQSRNDHAAAASDGESFISGITTEDSTPVRRAVTQSLLALIEKETSVKGVRSLLGRLESVNSDDVSIIETAVFEWWTNWKARTEEEKIIQTAQGAMRLSPSNVDTIRQDAFGAIVAQLDRSPVDSEPVSLFEAIKRLQIGSNIYSPAVSKWFSESATKLEDAEERTSAQEVGQWLSKRVTDSAKSSILGIVRQMQEEDLERAKGLAQKKKVLERMLECFPDDVELETKARSIGRSLLVGRIKFGAIAVGLVALGIAALYFFGQ